jgi:SWI/SNF-related matrix-associated actin-dependent regulator 1 of chromatin subfamily A
MHRTVINKYSKVCDKCKEIVLVGQGFAVVDSNKWKSFHATCIPDEYKFEKPLELVQVCENTVRIKFPWWPELISQIKNLEHQFRKFDPANKSWTIHVNKSTINTLNLLISTLNLNPTDNIKNFVPVADEVDDHTLSADDERLKSLGLYPFQIEGVKFLKSKKRALLGDDMGLGKSVQALMAIAENDAVIIVCPSCVKYSWAKEIKNWRPDYTAVMINKKSDFVLPQKNQIVIVNRENIPDSYDRKHGFEKSPWTLQNSVIDQLKNTCLIVDEAHKFKSTTTSGSRKLRYISKHTHTCWLLTGTPILNRAKDIWGVLSSGHMEKIVFTNFDNFMRLYNCVQGAFGLEYGLPLPQVPELLSRVRIARKKENVLPELPAKIFTKMIVSLSDSMEGKKILAMLDNLDPAIKEMVNNGKLPPFKEFAKIRTDIAKNRIPAMLEYLEDCEESEVPVIVFSAHLAPLNALRSRENWGIIDGSTPPEIRLKIVENFQAGILDGIACTIEAGGVGLTMTRAQKVLFVDMDWTPANNWQAEDRICRIGSKHRSVEVVQMISDHPLDVHVHNLIEEKKNLIKLSLDGASHD